MRSARFAAAARALERERADAIVDDELARSFVDAMTRVALARFGAERSVGLIALRTRWIDDEVGVAAAAGIKQVVVLGAGFDVRPLRLPVAKHLRWIELDHGEVIEEKERLLRQLNREYPVIRVRGDLRQQSSWALLRQRLRAGGGPCLWVLEGLVGYLKPGEARRLFANIAETDQAARIVFDVPSRAVLPSTEVAQFSRSMFDVGQAFRCATDNPASLLPAEYRAECRFDQVNARYARLPGLVGRDAGAWFMRALSPDAHTGQHQPEAPKGPQLSIAALDTDQEMANIAECLAFAAELPPSARVLELGAGTGRVALALAEAGLHVTAVEHCAERAELIRQGAAQRGIDPERIKVLRRSMCRLPETPAHALAFLVGNGLIALHRRGAARRCFARVFRNLQPGGRFVVEFSSPTHSRFHANVTPVRLDPATGVRYRRYVADLPASDGRRRLVYRCESLNGEVLRRSGYYVRLFSSESVAQLLQHAGFEIEANQPASEPAAGTEFRLTIVGTRRA